MKISIAMATYNGARFIGEQLESFASQTVLPNELVVCDDCSTDGTRKIVRRFGDRAPFAVRLHENATRLGVTRNFEKAIGLCQGDIVFLSDQDDAWFENKLQVVSTLFEGNPLIMVITNDQIITEAESDSHGLHQNGKFQGRWIAVEQNGCRLLHSLSPLLEGCRFAH